MAVAEIWREGVSKTQGELVLCFAKAGGDREQKSWLMAL